MYESIFGDILYHARVRPFAPAVHFGNDVSYAVFARDIEAFTRRLAQESLAPGTRVVVHVGGRYLSWLVLFACARLGLASVSVGDASELSLPKASVCITNLPKDRVPFDGRIVTVAREWANSGSPATPWQEPVHQPTDMCRLALSSGTTGAPKMAGITYEQLRRRCALGVGTYGMNPRSRVLVTMGTPTVAGYVMPQMAWMAGGTVILPTGTVAEAWRDARPSIMVIAPARLPELLDALPPFGAVRPELEVYVAGSVMAPALSERARQLLTPSLYICYGSTEISTGTIMHAAEAGSRQGCIGYAPPYVQAEVVDGSHRPVPHGVEGTLRFRAEGMADGYVDDPEATARSFRDGWFYPGDRGVMDASGMLQVVGRDTELANLGGEKLAPDRVDAALDSVAGVRELAAFAVPREGVDEMWLGVVPAAGFDEAALQAAYLRAFPRCPRPTIMRVDKIPRNEMGKVLRKELRARAESGAVK